MHAKMTREERGFHAVGGLMNRFTMAVPDVCLLLLDKGQKLGHNDDQ
jgi:hypothetical protein